MIIAWIIDCIYFALKGSFIMNLEKPHELLNLSKIDVLDESLYCYNNDIFSLTPAMQNRTTDKLYDKIEKFVNSVPAVQKSIDNLKSKTVYEPMYSMLSAEIRNLIKLKKVELIPCANSTEASYLQLRSTVNGLIVNGKEYGKNIKIKDIPLGEKVIPTDITGAMQCISNQNQLNQILKGIKEISEACELNFSRIIQGQRDDRIARLLSSRSSFIQALVISDESLQRQMLVEAIRDANSARAELAFQIRSDINLLGSEKTLKSKEMEKVVYDINTALIGMNNAVQLSLHSFQALGEHTAQLSVIKEYETFIKQVLLKEIEYKKEKYTAWNLIASSGNCDSISERFYSMPKELINSCILFIENNKNTIIQLEDDDHE